MLGKFFQLRIAFALLVIVACGALLLNHVRTTSASATAGLSSVIVELRDDPAAVYKAKVEKSGGRVTDEALQSYRDQLRVKQDQFLDSLRAQGVNFNIESVNINDFTGQLAAKIDYRFTLVYNGVTLAVPASAIPIIKSLPQVKDVQQNGMLHIALERSVDYIQAPPVYGKTQELTAFDDLREGYEGQGMNIAVLDTGIEWAHDMFGGDPTPPRLGVAPPTAAVNTNKKVIYYLPIVGTKDGYGHGTAAASNSAGYLGIAPGADKIPGTADDIKIHGVAPQARLMGYKVCADVGSCPEAATILAIEDAVSPFNLTGSPKPVAHVINLSLGGAGGPDDASAVACDNAVKLGTIVVASAGNEGPGDGTVGSPAAGTRVIAVGANTDPGTGVNTADVIGGNTGMKAIAMDGSPAVLTDIAQNFVYCGLGETPDTIPDAVRGKIALIMRGSTINTPELPAAGSLGTGLFQTKTYWATAKGAVAVIFINNVDGELSATTVRASAIPVFGMSQANGRYLLSLLGAPASNPDNAPVGAVSTQILRINKTLVFTPDMADFSSRGPVQGLGQIKPDVTAPGVAILSATIRAGSADANTGTMFDPTGYIHASGTSFSGPHVTGAAAIVKQAHLDWTPDMVRTALINTATNLRTASGTPKADGLAADSITAQGGGLISVAGAVNAKALMGVAGDGINQPSILGSHSFGAVPVINSRVTHTETQAVTIQDVSGQGGTYTLSVVNNRGLERNGISATTSTQTINVPAGGTATFNVNAIVDGSVVRDTTEPIQMQWYVVAKNASGQVHMPFFMLLTPTLPAGAAASEPLNFAGNMPASDGGLQLLEGTTYQDYTFTTDSPAAQLDVRLDWQEQVDDVFADMDFYLYGPDGAEVTHSAEAGGPEHIATQINTPGTYTLRVVGFANGPTDYTITGSVSKGGAAPNVQPIVGEFTDAEGKAVDFDGRYTLQWQPVGSADRFEIEQSIDGVNYTVAGQVAGNATSQTFTGEVNGQHFYRIRALTPGQIGSYVTPPSNASSILVDLRGKVDITSQIEKAISNVTFTGGVFKLDLAFKNNSASAYVPIVDLQVVSISATSNTVSVRNAENGGDGKSTATAALFGYSNQLGADQVLSAGETTGTRTLEFNDPAAEMFNFYVQVTAYENGATPAAPGGAAPSSPASGGGGSTSPTGSLPKLTGLLRITANPLTKTVTAQLVR
ncbi:MAG TPA: S8 family serine peptidase [Pyrinomonadaceae bacterium]